MRKEKSTRRRGRPSEYDGMRFRKAVKDTTRKPNSKGRKSWDALKNGMTYEEFKDAGGARKFLSWEILKGHVEIISE